MPPQSQRESFLRPLAVKMFQDKGAPKYKTKKTKKKYTKNVVIDKELKIIDARHQCIEQIRKRNNDKEEA